MSRGAKVCRINHQPKLEDKDPQTNDKRLATVLADFLYLSTLTYCVGDVVDHDGSLGSPVVHGC